MPETDLGKQFLERSQKDPVWWLKTVLGQDLWAKQLEIAEAIRDNPRVAVRSGHASGKTYLTASLALWFANSFPGSMTITTAPGDRQVKKAMWGEIELAYNQSKMRLGGRFYPRSARYELGPKWGMLGFATDKPGRFSGYHAPYILIVIDEASEVEEYVFHEIEGIRSAGAMIRVVMLSQMTRTSGAFYDAFNRNQAAWKTFTISSFDTPNFAPAVLAAWKAAGSPVEGFPWPTPYLCNPVWEAEMAAFPGKDSDEYRVRVLGIAPKGEATAIIPLHLVEVATKNILSVPKEGGTWMGLDIALGGEDSSYIFIRRGPVVLYGEEFNATSTNPTRETVEWALDTALRFGVTDINVDDIGIGKGVADELEEAALPHRIQVHPINFGSKPRDTEHYLNRRAEDYMGLRMRFESKEISLVNIAEDLAGPKQIDRLLPELSGLKKNPVSPAGKLSLERKEEFKKRLGRSPDAADALCLAFATPYDEIAIITMNDDDPKNFGDGYLALPPEPDPFFDMTSDW